MICFSAVIGFKVDWEESTHSSMQAFTLYWMENPLFCGPKYNKLEGSDAGN
jgi:hypothetical protein